MVKIFYNIQASKFSNIMHAEHNNYGKRKQIYNINHNKSVIDNNRDHSSTMRLQGPSKGTNLARFSNNFYSKCYRLKLKHQKQV